MQTTFDVNNGINTRVIEAHGYRISLREAGEGPLVLFLHGFPELSYSWRHQLPALAEAGYHAVAIDQLGFGRSSKPKYIHDYRITELVAVSAAVVETLGESTAVVVGHDWGAPVAWTCAWTRPDVFEAVVGASLPFAGRGLMALPGSPHGELRPTEADRAVAGPERIFYQEYITLPEMYERELEADVRRWLADFYYSSSASMPLPGGAEPLDLESLSYDDIVGILRATPVTLPPGGTLIENFHRAEPVDWMSDEDLDVYVSEFERTGFTGGANWYRALDLSWELLAPYEGRPVEVPALYIGGDRDAPTLWGREAIERMPEAIPDLRGSVIFENCGHWIQLEQVEQFNRELLAFLAEVKPVPAAIAARATQ